MQYQPRIAFGRQPGAPSAGQRGLERAATDLAVVGVVSVKQRKNQSRGRPDHPAPPPVLEDKAASPPARDIPWNKSCFQTYHRVEYQRWEDVLPLTDEDAEEKWRGEEDWARARHPGLFAQARRAPRTCKTGPWSVRRRSARTLCYAGASPARYRAPIARAGSARGPARRS